MLLFLRMCWFSLNYEWCSQNFFFFLGTKHCNYFVKKRSNSSDCRSNETFFLHWEASYKICLSLFGLNYQVNLEPYYFVFNYFQLNDIWTSETFFIFSAKYYYQLGDYFRKKRFLSNENQLILIEWQKSV